MNKHSFMIDLCKIDGDGAFPCPRCASNIDPDDDSYRVIDTDLKDGLLIECSKCKAQIELIGLGTKVEA